MQRTALDTESELVLRIASGTSNRASSNGWGLWGCMCFEGVCLVMVTPREANKTRWREEKWEKIKPRNPFYCCERAKEYNAAGGTSCIMQVTTAAQLLQGLTVVSTRAANDAKCIMSGEEPGAGLVTERSKVSLSCSTETKGWPEKDLHAHWKIQSCSRNSHPGDAGHCSLLDLSLDVSWAVLGDPQRARHGSDVRAMGEWVPNAWWHKGMIFLKGSHGM